MASHHPTHTAVLIFTVTLFLHLPPCAKCEFVNTLDTPIFGGARNIYTTKYAHIPDYGGLPAKIVSITPWAGSLYVCTSTSGARIYRVAPDASVSLWFDVKGVMANYYNRRVDVSNSFHGGVRSIAFHPQYERNGFFYLSLIERRAGAPWRYRYVSRPPGGKMKPVDSVVVEWRVFPRSRKPDPKSLRDVLRVGLPEYDHPIKQMTFHGHWLYITHGDASVQSATAGGGLAYDALGKVLRIDPRGKSASGKSSYSIPPWNPFVSNRRFPPEVFAVGFRNPHNLCFSKSGDLYVADAGRDNFEEINIVKYGHNYGWSDREGFRVHLERGGVGTGIAPLPPNDARFGYTYPVAVLGHLGMRGQSLSGQAIAMSCPIENGSKLDGVLLYANFPSDGALYYSFTSDLRNAIVTGNPKKLRSARTYTPKIFYWPNKDRKRKPIRVNNLRQVVQLDPGYGGAERADMRFGSGSDGTIYWSSKTNGWIYVLLNTRPI